jgi:hypothetical protein
MLVKILSFGCNWWRRYGSDPGDSFRYTRRAVFYNSTGVQCGSKIRRHWVIPGLIRFNGGSDFAPHHFHRCIGQTFRCTDPVYAFGGNRVVFESRLKSAEPDYFLVVVSNDRFGAFDFRSAEWMSADCHPIAASHLRETQEAMLLMKLNGWVQSDIGRWHLTPTKQLQTGAMLLLAEQDGTD